MAKMKIERAHSHTVIELFKHELSAMPPSWLTDIRDVKWVIYPDSLSPLFTGLMKDERMTRDGRKCSESGGWYLWSVSDNITLKDKHIFLTHSRWDGVVHEAAHALSYKWHVNEEEFYKPETAFHRYMASNPAEYFACAVDAFLRPARDDRGDVVWHRERNAEDLAKVNPDLYSYLMTKLGGGNGEGKPTADS